MTAWLCLLAQMVSCEEPRLNDGSGSETADDVTETSPTPPLPTKNKGKAKLPLAFIESLAWKHFCSKTKLPDPHSRRIATRDIVESHFVDAWWQLRKLIIGFKNVYDHKGATIGKVLIDCMAKWDIKRVFCITVDNATANINAMETFKEEFKQIGDDEVILNSDFLHLRSSTPRLKAFENHVESRRIQRGSLPLDVKTRWNSTYVMLDQDLKFRWHLTRCMSLIFRISNTSRMLWSINPGPDEALREKSFSMLMKLSKYWDPFDKRVEMNKLIFVAAVFDPSKKMKFIEKRFDKLYGKGPKSDDLKEEVLNIFKNLFDEYISALNKNESGESGSLAQSNEASTRSGQSREEASQKMVLVNGS
ncbi:unnamed protein product [Microthlaspi erraticum]|uniref:hAT-like transposase RNase-H fold domain-containing protein n=1 Tax=Microthlaspi erraticum TaxID=1685480 RepID=A0A6D2HP61_9BRAS|nr:unnamed protein product [Microthlaspi erraticum]